MKTVAEFAYALAGSLPAPVMERMQDVLGRNRRLRRAAQHLTRGLRTGTHTIARGPAKGMLIDVGASRPGYALGTVERNVTDFLATHVKPGDTVFDLGANVGYLTLCAAALTGPDGRVVAVEPLPSNAATLRRNVALNSLDHVAVEEAAVSAAGGHARLAIGSSDQDSSLVMREDAQTLEVRTVSLVELIARHGRPDLVKLDIEGAEQEVLEASEDALGDARPVILCEVHIGIPDLDSPVPRLLSQLGYEIAWLEADAENQDRFWAPHLVALPR